MRVNGAERLPFEREVAAVVHEHRLQRRCIECRRRPPEQGDPGRRRIVREPDARRERDLDADGRVLGYPGCSEDAVIQAVAHEQGIVGVRRQSLLCVPGRECASFDAVARDASAAVALERLLVEEAPALFEPLDQALELGRAVKLFGIAVKGDGARSSLRPFARRSAGSSGSRIRPT